MNQPLKKLKEEALLLNLNSTEKAALHASLMRAMQKDAATEDASASRMIPSPFYFAPRFAMSFAAFLLIVVTGGTAYAAKGSLPGDLLYTVKTGVSEPIEGALSFSVESKIKFHSEVAQTRLEEAEVLASQNRLDADATQKLESDIDAHISERDNLVATLNEKSPDAGAAVVGELDSSIAAHSEVLAALGNESHSTTTRDNSDALASRTRVAFASRAGGNAGGAVLMMAKSAAPIVPAASSTQKPMAVTMSLGAHEERSGSEDAAVTNQATASPEDTKAEARAATDSQSKNEKAALALEKRATTSLEALKRSADAARPHLDTDVAAKLDTRLARVVSLVASGEAALADKDFDTAKDDFSQALSKSVTLSTFIAANARFDSGILGNLLNQHQDEGDEGGE